MTGNQPYPPIGDYGFIADCHATALVSRSGSIDWACMDRFDRGSAFARLLDWRRGGFCLVSPTDKYSTERAYLPGTLILRTVFRSAEGEACLHDFFSMRKGGKHAPYRQLLRIVEGVRGTMRMLCEVCPVFEYGTIKPWIRDYARGGHVALGGNAGLHLSGNMDLSLTGRERLSSEFELHEGERRILSIIHGAPEMLDECLLEVLTVRELGDRLAETEQWWRDWSSQSVYTGPYEDHALRSAIVLKGLTHAPSGAVAAAATTSLPESPGGSRNWDYRFSWIRDSVFTVRSLTELGYTKEADGFRRFIERSSAGRAEEIQILFGVGGERHLNEYELGELEGYRGARPVRIGNAAESQMQGDVYGELLDLASIWWNRGHDPEPHYCEFLIEIVNMACQRWKLPDQGIWEMRGAPRHFVHSKAMCWAALDRGLAMAAIFDGEAPLDLWRSTRDEIRRSVERDGYDAERGVFVQAYGSREVDAALLLLPASGIIGYTDERMVRTTDAVWNDLANGKFLRRYPLGNDGMDGVEGAFLPCSFWLVNCLVRQGRISEAREVMEDALSAANDLGLFSEEYDVQNGEMLGNFPQALTHLSLISAIVAFAGAEETGSANALQS